MAQQVNECLRIAIGKYEFLAGTTEPVADGDDRFIADFIFSPGPRDGKYKLSTVEGSADVACFLGAQMKQSAFDAPLTNELSVTCQRPAGKPTTGRFIFRSTVDNSTLRVPFSVPSKTVQAKAIEAMKLEFVGQIESMIDKNIPTGTILPWFAKAGPVPTGFAICDGRNGTPDLRGRFMMGSSNYGDVGGSGGANSQSASVSIPTINLATGGTNHNRALRMDQGNGVINHQTGCAACNLVNSFTQPAAGSVSVDIIPTHVKVLYIMKL